MSYFHLNFILKGKLYFYSEIIKFFREEGLTSLKNLFIIRTSLLMTTQ